MKYFKTFLLAIFFGIVFNAQADETMANANEDALDPTSREVRSKSNFSFNVAWAPVQVPFPNALGFNANYVASESWMFGLDYMTSGQAIKFLSYDFGEIRERTLTLQARRFVGNSFNWKMGIGHRRTEAKLAQNLFNVALGDYSLTVSELRANFFRFGFGNLWQINRKYTLAVDWLTINIPFNANVQTSASQYGSSATNTADIQNAENILKYYPSGSIIQFEVGLIF